MDGNKTGTKVLNWWKQYSWENDRKKMGRRPVGVLASVRMQATVYGILVLDNCYEVESSQDTSNVREPPLCESLERVVKLSQNQ